MPAAPLADVGELSEDVPADSGVCGTLCSHMLREVAEVVTHTISDHHLAPPSVSLLLVGRHPAALSYARSTVAAARAASVALRIQQLPETATHNEVACAIGLCNADPTCHGACSAPCLRATRVLVRAAAE